MLHDHLGSVIGIDGGGTLCRGAILRSDGRRIEISGPGANVTTDREAAIAAVRAVLTRLRATAGMDVQSFSRLPAHLGLAGILDDGQAEAMRSALGLTGAVVSDDRVIALVGALEGGDGAVVGLGTGSFVGSARGGTMRFAGGWGLILGDTASGAWLGRSALAETLRACDGLAPRDPLSCRLLEEMGGAAGIVMFARRADPADFAALAPRVVEAAGQGEAMSVSLMRRGADYVREALGAVGWEAPDPVCLLGGLASACAPWLDPALQDALAPARGDALDGALALARARQAART